MLSSINLKMNMVFAVAGIARNIEPSENTFNLDVSNTNALEQIIAENKFDVIVNCIGILNKDAENNPDKAIWFNSYFPHYLEKNNKKYCYQSYSYQYRLCFQW